MSDELLRLEDVHASYSSIEVLKGLSLQVNRGEMVTIIGANGAGKTTTLLAIAGVKPISRGKVYFQDKDVSDVRAHQMTAAGLSLVPEGRRIFPRLTVMENLEMGAFLAKDRRSTTDGLDYCFSLFPILSERRHQSGGTLSGGEQQMLAIARALMSRPSLLLLDEPSMGIAPILVQRIFESICELNRRGLTILLVEQNAHLALQVCDRAYVLETGCVVIEGSAEALRRDPRIEEAYLGG